MFHDTGPSCDSTCVGLVVGLILGIILIAAIVVVFVFIRKRKRSLARQQSSSGPHVSNVMVTCNQNRDSSPYEYVNPLDVNGSDRLSTDSTSKPSINSQYITVGTVGTLQNTDHQI